MTPAELIAFGETLTVPTGPLAGQNVRFAPHQKRFTRGALRNGVSIAVLTVARGGGKSTLAGVFVVAEFFHGIRGEQPRREIIIAAAKRDQAEIVWTYAHDLILAYIADWSEEERREVKFRYSPRLEIEWRGHKIKAIAADGKGALGLSPTLVVADELAAWPERQGAELFNALQTSLLKRNGLMIVISTSAPTDTALLSRLIDEDDPTVYAQEHRAPPGSRPDDPKALAAANPGSKYGVGPPIPHLVRSGKRAMMRGGSELSSHRNLHMNERTSDATREAVVTVDEYAAVETTDLPPREGAVVVGLDLGGSASMSAAAYFWPATGRLEVRGWFPSRPGLGDRGQRDGVGERYLRMAQEGTLETLGDAVTPVKDWIAAVLAHVPDETIAAVVFDTFKQSEVGEGLRACGVRAPYVLRRFGPFDGGEDLERFRRAILEKWLRTAPTLLMRSAMADAICRRDGNLNPCLDKGRSLGRIDPVAAALLAVAEGSRIAGRAAPRELKWVWS
jgi:phage terminase large subunit-like protein